MAPRIARTAGDFLNAARSNNGRSAKTISASYANYTQGNAGSGVSVLTADPSFDSPDSEPERNDENLYGYYSGSSESEQGEDAGAWSPDPGVRVGYRGSEYSDDPGIGDYEQDGDSYPESYKPAKSSRGRVTQKRSSFLTKTISDIGKHLPKSKPKSKVDKVVAATRKLLTLAEVSRDKTILINLVMWTTDHIDDGLAAVTRGHRQVIIWSDMEYSDAELLVDNLLTMGQKTEYWATAVRSLVEWESKVRLAAIVLPRTVRTIMFLFTTGIEVRW